MGKRSFLRLALAGVLPALATMTWVTGAAAATTITTCGPLTKLGETYNLANDLTSTSCETCLTVANNRITINLKNHVITANCDGSGPDIAAGISDGGIARDLTTVRDGSIGGFDAGIDLTSSTRSTVLNVLVVLNVFAGIAVGDTSLVKSSLAAFNFLEARGWREGAGLLFHDNQRIGAEPTAIARGCQRFFSEAVPVGRVEKHHRERLVRMHVAELGGVAAKDFCDAAEPERFHIGADEGARLDAVVDELRKCRAA